MRCTPDPSTAGRRRGAALASVFGLLLTVAPADAHIVVGDRPLQAFVAESELVLHVKILAAGERVPVRADPAGGGRPFVEARVIERLKGPETEDRVRFAQHGHGVVPFEPGDEALIFLIHLSRSRELDELASSTDLSWVSLQEHGEGYRFSEIDGVTALEAARSYVAAEQADTAGERLQWVRRANFALLGSRDARLASSVVQALAADPGAPWLAPEDAPSLLAIVEDSATPIGVRVALLTELGRRGLAKGSGHWLGLLSEDAPASERLVAIRAAGYVTDPVVRGRLLAMTRSPDAGIAAAAARALGGPRDPIVIPVLVEALKHAAPTVRLAAIRSLGLIRTPEALDALATAAESHPDPATRRHARAELRARGGEKGGGGGA